MNFKNANGKECSFEDIFNRIKEYKAEFPDNEYRMYISTDSQVFGIHRTTYVSAIAIHRVGKGAIYFFKKFNFPEKHHIFQRLLKETADSVDLVQTLMTLKIEELIPFENIEIHIDVGENGKSREVLPSCTGYCEGLGFKWKVKPGAAAIYISDRHCRV